jgi:WD40 repeat protein
VIALGTLRPFEKRLEVWLADVKRVNKVVMSPSARMVAASTSEGQVVLVDVARGDEVRRLQVLDSTGVGVRLVRRVAWAGEERLLTGDDDGRLGIWQVSTGACERMIDAHSSAISGLEWWEREHVAMTVDRKGTVKIWGVNAPMPLAAVEFPVQRVSDVKLDRGRLLVAAWSQVCGAWDVAAQDQSLRDNFDYYFEVYERGGGTAKREDVEAWLRERLLGTPGDAMEE